MKIEQLLNEHKKGVKAVKYAKKPVPLVGPEAQKKKAKVKTAPPKTELEKHSKLKTTLEYKEKNSMKISDLVEANYSYAADDEGISPEEQLRRAKLLGFQTPRTVSYKDTDGVEASFQHTVHGSLIDLNWTNNGKDYHSWVEKGMVAFRDPQNLKKNVAFHQTQLNTQLQQGNEREAKNHAYKIGSMSAHLQDAEQYQRVKDKVAQLSQGASGSATDKTAAVNSIPVDSNVQKLQQAILKRDPKALPRYGADGKLGKETRTAMAKYPDIAKQFPGIKEGRPKGYDSDGNPQGGGYDEYDNSKKSWTVVVDGNSWKTFDDERQAYKAADAIRQKYGKKTRVISEGKIKIKIKHPPETAQEKLYKKHQELRKKSGLPDPEEYKKKAAEKQKEIDDMKEAKQPEASKPRNFVAKNAKTAGAGVHKDAKKASKEVRGQKHKNKEMAETYDQARAARIRYALMIKEGEWDQQSDEMTPPEYDMNPEELKAIRNAEFTDEDKIQAMVKLAAGGTSDEDIAKIYDMDKETVAGILDDYVEEIEAETDQDADVKEAEMGKIVDYKPGQTATLNTGPGMTTIVDLKKNPTSLTKDPATGKLKLMGPQATGAQSATATAQPTIKAGDAVEIGKVESLQDIRRLSGFK